MAQQKPCIGLDFDNTIVCYDQLFHQVALEKGLIPQETSPSKEAVRNYLKSMGNENLWTLLQGDVYGKRMEEAVPFPGLLNFLHEANKLGFKIVIVSHKTKIPYMGPPYDLHEAALAWMDRQRFFEVAGININREDVYFEVSKEEKLQRIAATGCHLFIDDLPEILAHPGFPKEVERVLFSSSSREAMQQEWLTASTWKELLLLVQNYFSSYEG